MARAVRERSRVNVFHRATAITVDTFVMGGSPLDDEQMTRRQRIQVTVAPDQSLSAYTPEDVPDHPLLDPSAGQVRRDAGRSCDFARGTRS